MNPVQIIVSIIFLIFSVETFAISYFQFKEKGYLFNNAYFWASPEERKKMDKNKESKKPHYRQSGFAFMFIGILCLILAVHFITGWMWMLVPAGLFVVILVVYAVYPLFKSNGVNSTNLRTGKRQLLERQDQLNEVKRKIKIMVALR